MKREALIELVRQQMPAKRWEHTLGVIDCALALAARYGANQEQAELAAILHDYAKYWPIAKQRQVIEQDGRRTMLLHYDPPLWHAEAGAIVAETELHIHDQEVLNAIRYHTSGREQMTVLEKVVCLADYIEPGRQYPGVEQIRDAANISLEQGLLAGLEHTIHFLLARRKTIYPETIKARNDLLRQVDASSS